MYDAQQNFAVVAVVHVDANLPQHAWGPSGGDEHLTLATSPEHSVVACVTSRAPDRVYVYVLSMLLTQLSSSLHFGASSEREADCIIDAPGPLETCDINIFLPYIKNVGKITSHKSWRKNFSYKS